MTCEFLTPMYPQHFLLLASISNVGRAVGLTTFVSTQPAFQQALCASGNMADLASKTQVGVGVGVVWVGWVGGSTTHGERVTSCNQVGHWTSEPQLGLGGELGC
jgi:hypothetical protein